MQFFSSARYIFILACAIRLRFCVHGYNHEHFLQCTQMTASRWKWCWDSSAWICRGAGSTVEPPKSLGNARPSAAPTSSSGIMSSSGKTEHMFQCFPSKDADLLHVVFLQWNWGQISSEENQQHGLQTSISAKFLPLCSTPSKLQQ